MFTITKTFDFEYAHRVYTQNVKPNLACGETENSCRHIHGHSGKLSVTISSAKVDDRGFVLDYKELGFIKQMVKTDLDHKLIMGADDPMLKLLQGGLLLTTSSPTNIVDELYGSFTIVPIIPTSENLAKYYYERIDAVIKEMSLPVYLMEVSWSETPSSTAVYSTGVRAVV